MSEEDNATWSETITVVSEFVKDKLGVILGEIERAHRLVSKRTGSSRPITATFLNSMNENELLRNAFKLKNTTTWKRRGARHGFNVFLSTCT